MNKIKVPQIFILLIIFSSMLAVIFISREVFLSNDQTYQPSSSLVKVKANQKTYSRLIALNQMPSPTPSEVSPSPLLTGKLHSPTESPTPTEIILVKAVSPTNDLKTSPTSTEKETTKEIPETGFYQNLNMLLVISILTIFFSFTL